MTEVQALEILKRAAYLAHMTRGDHEAVERAIQKLGELIKDGGDGAAESNNGICTAPATSSPAPKA